VKRPAFRYLWTTDEFHLDGHGQVIHDAGFAVPLSVARDASLSSLKRALARYGENYGKREVSLQLADVAPERFDDDTPLEWISIEWRPDALRLRVEVPLADRPTNPARLVAPVLARHQAEVLDEGGWESDDESYVAEFLLRLPWRGRTVGDWHDVGVDVQVLLWAAQSGELSPDAAADVIRAGRADLLVGHAEADWLEAKSQAYGDTMEDKVELAKDVASFANAAGGLIVLGLKTKRRGDEDLIRSVNEVPLGAARPRALRQRIARHVFPVPEGLVVEQVPGSSAGFGVVFIRVPAQPPGRKPFIVSGAVIGRRLQGAFLTIPTREYADTTNLDARTLHARLRVGQRALEGLDGGVRQTIWRETLPPLIAQVVHAAEHAGFAVDVGSSTAVFRAPDGRQVASHHAGLSGVTEDLELQRLLVELSRLGLAVRRTPRGALMPAELFPPADDGRRSP
jgi:hypothetical protein